MRTSNPALNSSTFADFLEAGSMAEAMTVQGTINKTGFLTILLVAGAAWPWYLYTSQGAAGPAAVIPWMIGGAIGGLVVALITMFAVRWAAFTAPLYAVLEGLFLGGLSAIIEKQLKLPGIVTQAVALTMGVLVCMLLAYSMRLVRATEKFKLGILAATGAIGLVYLVSMLLGIFGVQVPYIHGAGPIGIAFSVVVVVVAALNLVLDFDFVEQGVARGAPKYMEWYAAFGLLVTLVWLYIEILRLLAKLRSRD